MYAIGLILIYHPLQTETSSRRGSKGLHTWFLLRFSKLRKGHQQKPMVRWTIYGSMAPCEPTTVSSPLNSLPENCQGSLLCWRRKRFSPGQKQILTLSPGKQWKETNSSWEDSSVTDACLEEGESFFAIFI